MNETVEPAPGNGGQAAPASRWRGPRLRYSLATLILLATIVCLLVALWTTSRRFQEATVEAEMLRSEIRKYREEMGYLTISDPSKAHAIGVPAHDSLKWQWRVYLPENRRFRLHVVTGGVPNDGVRGTGRRSGSESMIRSGESLLYAAVQKDHRGKWVFRVEEGDSGRGSTTVIQPTDERWIEGGSGWSTQQVNPGRTQSYEPGEPIVLLRLRGHEIGEKTDDGRTSGHPPDEPCDGLMIWIDETP